MSTNEGCLSSETFLVKVSEFFKIANEKKITVHLTLKRLIDRDPVEENPELDSTKQPFFDVSQKATGVVPAGKEISTKEYPLLIRISYGSHAKKTKCSTIINSDQLDKFWQDYTSVVKSSMNGLIKKKKKKGKSAGTKDKKKGKK
ncbi:RNA-binding signal recognition particle subunit SRP14 NDAI_0B03150 [Naumovozyma dairenensis CBS 421]|uniref:Signal recognition particle subunit SRP14 n=1 Tax=Naumovozyma dairenensis (strain ATCC 10597 / BCRC 20456 / CBS 421 / NBRC 0211 / NRRL Y-12639) TaxID=1071378 RepID=G0W6D9_NAUDC|nr:hypothetical protein NDAI_0B03150 [Naumovozyma dairenensis CBS 421]CCD23350.1 hypothetical protein NDAI_0B03150 [Naumovozyma dairenensis CBS 421]